MSHKDWRDATLPKAQGSWNLHQALPSGMDFFVMLSSVCGVFGNSGQSNYGAGNTYQDALAEYRRSIGEKSIALDLGIVLSEGYLAENETVMNRLMRLGLFLPIEQEDLFAMFDYYCDQGREIAESFQSQLITGLEVPANMVANGSEIPLTMRSPLFAHMRQIDSNAETSSSSKDKASGLHAAFKGATSKEEAQAVVAEALRVKLSKMLGIAYEDIMVGSRVESFGVDSLVAVEIRNWLSKETAADIAVFEILGGNTLEDIASTATSKGWGR